MYSCHGNFVEVVMILILMGVAGEVGWAEEGGEEEVDDGPMREEESILVLIPIIYFFNFY